MGRSMTRLKEPLKPGGMEARKAFRGSLSQEQEENHLGFFNSTSLAQNRKEVARFHNFNL